MKLKLKSCQEDCFHYPVCKFRDEYNHALNVSDYCDHFYDKTLVLNNATKKESIKLTEDKKKNGSSTTSKKNVVYLYTDGACSGNPGPGGWGAILKAEGREDKELSGGDENTTNNKMELMAAISGLEAIKKPCKVVLTSDSKYLIDSITKGWVYNWKNKNWKRNSKPVPNTELWKRLLVQLERHEVEFIWVRGHAGHSENERCDKLATDFIKSLRNEQQKKIKEKKSKLKGIKIIDGDILTPNTDPNRSVIVCHQVNCMGIMGSGLAWQVARTFPDVYRAYKEKCDAFGAENLGKIQLCSCLEKSGYIICNVFGQVQYGRDKRYTDYNALRKAFIRIYGIPNTTIRIPYHMGCGLAGGNWDKVLEIIQEELIDKGCTVEIWKLPRESTKEGK